MLDCDNTLWGGIVGEDGINNILLGQDGIGEDMLIFEENQKLSQQGVLLCISSKNNTKDVMEV